MLEDVGTDVRRAIDAAKAVALPAGDASWARNDIDRFILAAIEKAGLGPGRDADKRALIRRATYDLIGLPPTLEEIDAFLNDKSPDAFAKRQKLFPPFTLPARRAWGQLSAEAVALLRRSTPFTVSTL